MPSGFQQDSNQLQPNFYRVAIDTTVYPTADGNDNGAVTPNGSDSFSTANQPTTLAKGKQRARGVMRFENIVRRLTALADCQLMDITITEANADAQATAVAFTVKFDRDAFISGTKADTIKNAVAQGIIDERSASARVFDPTSDSEVQIYLSITKPVADLTAALTNVTVTLNSETTLVNA